MPQTVTSKLSPVSRHGGRSLLQRACVPQWLVFHTFHHQGLWGHLTECRTNSIDCVPYGRILPKTHCSRLFLRLKFFMTTYEPALDPLRSSTSRTKTCVLGMGLCYDSVL